jgi:Ribose 5-phosphate isomerase RpiB
VLALGARVIGEELAAVLIREFLSARFSGAGGHRRRLEKIAAIERGETPVRP